MSILIPNLSKQNQILTKLTGAFLVGGASKTYYSVALVEILAGYMIKDTFLA